MANEGRAAGRTGSVVILAAGQGTRMRSPRPKVLHEVCGRPLVSWVLDQARSLEPERILLVLGHGADDVRAELERRGELEGVTIVHQAEQRGTGHALQVCLPDLGADPGRTVVLYGDMPVLAAETLGELVEAAEEEAQDGAALLTAYPDDPRGFGRILRGDDDLVVGIVEERDATPEQRAIEEVNLGVYAFDGPALVEALPLLSNDNRQGEFYLTDVVHVFAEGGRPVVGLEVADPDEAIGVNTLAHLAEARWALQMRILEEHMAAGVHVEDPATTYVDHGVEIGPGTRLLPCTVIRAGVRVGAGCEVGPFAHLRAGTVLADGAEVGNFVECKKSSLGAGTKAKHLSYLGDARIGAGANIGAGTIFANYDGAAKHVSVVGDGAFVGSGTIVVAPNEIGARAVTGAGAVVTRSAGVGPGEVWIGVPARRLRRAPDPRSSDSSSSSPSGGSAE